jgi:antitoxin (DNA-binding transcriptional repressor) of toxin-antitoxin stability system
MLNVVSKSQFKSKALEFFRQVETSGESVIITDHGQPKLEVRRFQPQQDEPLTRLRGTVLRYERPTEPVGAEDWEAAQ